MIITDESASATSSPLKDCNVDEKGTGTPTGILNGLAKDSEDTWAALDNAIDNEIDGCSDSAELLIKSSAKESLLNLNKGDIEPANRDKSTRLSSSGSNMLKDTADSEMANLDTSLRGSESLNGKEENSSLPSMDDRVIDELLADDSMQEDSNNGDTPDDNAFISANSSESEHSKKDYIEKTANSKDKNNRAHIKYTDSPEIPNPGVGRSLAAKVAEKCDKVLAGNSGDQIKCEKDSPYDNVSKKDVKLLGDSKDDKKPDNQIEPIKMEKDLQLSQIL